jgi:uncharacterized protein (TIGR03083 family)
MDYGEHVKAAEAGVRTLVDGFERAAPDARVPTCPDWTVADLADHVGGVAGFWAHVVAEGNDREKPPMPERNAGDPLAPWFSEIGTILTRELRNTAPGAPMWTWNPDDQSSNFIARRMAHELTVHGFDAQLAAGGGPADAIDAAVAADGIDEIFLMVDAAPDRAGRGNGETLHLHGTDRGDEWLLHLEPDGLRVERTHAKGDLALRGAVADLELLLYQRPPLGDIERFGDDAVLDVWYRVFTFG